MAKDKIINKQSKFQLIKHKFLSYMKAARFSGWLLVCVFFLLGEWYSTGKITLQLTILSLLGFGGIFSAGFMVNNVFDRELDTFLKKPFVKAFQYISPREMLVTSAIITIISLIALLYINIYVFFVGFIIAVIGVLYSVPPVRMKTRPPLDGIANALGALPFFAGWMVTGNLLTMESFYYGSILGLAVLSYYFLYTSLDIEIDKKLGVTTSCVKLGLDWSIFTGVIIFLITLALSIVFLGLLSLVTISFLVCLPFVLLTIKVRKNRKHLSRLVGGSIATIWVSTMLILLSILSLSVISIVILAIVCIVFLFEILFYMIHVRRNRKKL